MGRMIFFLSVPLRQIKGNRNYFSKALLAVWLKGAFVSFGAESGEKAEKAEKAQRAQQGPTLEGSQHTPGSGQCSSGQSNSESANPQSWSLLAQPD